MSNADIIELVKQFGVVADILKSNSDNIARLADNQVELLEIIRRVENIARNLDNRVSNLECNMPEAMH